MLDPNSIWLNLQEKLIDFISRLPVMLLALLVFFLFFWMAGRLSIWMKSFVN